MATSLRIPTTFTAVDKFSSVMRTMSKSVTKFSKKTGTAIQRFDQKISSSFKKLSKFSQLAIGVGVSALFLSLTNDVTTFEERLVGVGKTTGLAGNELKKLGSRLIDTSNDLKTVSTGKLLELAQSAGQLGVSGSDNIIRFSQTLAKLEKATDIQGEEGSSKIARLLTVTGEGVANIDKFGASLVALGNTSAATESEILEVASRVGRATASFGLVSDEILGISTTLKSLDVAPEAAGTAVGKVFRSIELATIKGGENLRGFAKVMGMTTGEVRKTFEESPKKAFLKFIEGLGKINDGGGSVQKAMLGVGLSGDRLMEVIPTVAKNFGLLDDKMKLANSSFSENTALNEEFAASQKTINASLQRVRIAWTNLFLKQAQAGSGLEKVQNVLNFVAKNIDLVAISLGVLAAAYVALKIAVGIIQAIAIATQIWTAAQWLFNAAMAANPLVWIILGIVAAIAAIILIIMNWSSIVDWFGKIWDKFTKWISGAWDRVVTFFKEFDFKKFFMDIGQSILKFLLLPMKGLLMLLSRIPGKIGKMAKIGVDKINEITGNVKVEDGTGDKPQAEPPGVVSARVTRENIQKNNLSIDIRDKGDNVENVKSEGDLKIPINITKTQAAF